MEMNDNPSTHKMNHEEKDLKKAKEICAIDESELN